MKINKYVVVLKDFIRRSFAKKEVNASSEKQGIPILSGDHAFLCLEQFSGAEDMSGMRRVTSRKAAFILNRGYFKSKSLTMGIYVDEEVTNKHSKIRLAADAYLRIGFIRSYKQQGRPLVIFGGDEAETFLNVEVLVFKKGKLLEVSEQKLPLPSSEMDYDERVDSLLSQIEQEYPDCVMEQCANLPRWDRPQIKHYHTSDIFKRLPIVDLQPSESVLRAYAPPVGMVVGAAAFYGFTVFSGFTQHQSLTQEARQLEREMMTLTDERSSIAIMEAREAFMNQEVGVEAAFIDDIKMVAGSVAMLENMEIQHIRAPGSNDIAAFLSISVPANGAPSALIQARGILDELVQRTDGFSLRLSRSQAIQTRGDKVIFHIEVLNG
jgi:hypothetical protein